MPCPPLPEVVTAAVPTEATDRESITVAWYSSMKTIADKAVASSFRRRERERRSIDSVQPHSKGSKALGRKDSGK